MIAYVFGAGASAHAGYPLASNLLRELSDWLDVQDTGEPGIETYRRRLAEVRRLRPSLEDLEEILRILDSYGQERADLGSADTQAQCIRDILEDAARTLMTDGREQAGGGSGGFYPQNLRDDLASAVREFYYDVESRRAETTAYDSFAVQRASVDDTMITFNYDVALERALRRAGKWDIGAGYGFCLFADRHRSPITVLKLHGSVNWFKAPLQEAPPPLVFSRDLELLGYGDIRDGPAGAGGSAVDNTGTLILPNPDKTFCWGRLWLPLWTSAAEQLRSVQELFIHGYSLPPADTRARSLLFDNVSPRATVHVFCRGDSRRVADEFRRRGFSDVRFNSATAFELWATGHTATDEDSIRCSGEREV